MTPSSIEKPAGRSMPCHVRATVSIRGIHAVGGSRRMSSSAAHRLSVVSARHLVELVGMHEQAPHRAAEPEIRRVGAGRKQQQEEGVDLVVGQPLTVDLRGGNAVPSTAGPPLRCRCW
ncbi:MAG: hypothetical protein V9E89_07135 [Ilumatobacteraceae bacterium]